MEDDTDDRNRVAADNSVAYGNRWQQESSQAASGHRPPEAQTDLASTSPWQLRTLRLAGADPSSISFVLHLAGIVHHLQFITDASPAGKGRGPCPSLPPRSLGEMPRRRRPSEVSPRTESLAESVDGRSPAALFLYT